MGLPSEEALNKADLQFKLLEYYLYEEGTLVLNKSLRRKVGNVAKDIGLTFDQVAEVVYPILVHMPEKIFPLYAKNDLYREFPINVKKGETALIILKYVLKTRHTKLDPNIKRSIPKIADEIGATCQEVISILQPLYKELAVEMFN